MKSKMLLSVGLIFVISTIGFGQTAKKTVTNADLEKFKEKRVQAEADYRAKYREMGMPSPEELEQRRVEDSRRLSEYSEQLQINKQQNQDYWQSRANVLRNELLNVNAQIRFLNSQIANLPTQNPLFVTPDQLNGIVIGSIPYGYNRGRGGYNQGRGRDYQTRTNTINPANNVQTVTNAAAGNPNPFYGTPLAQSGVKLVIGDNNQRYGRRGYGRNYGYYGGYYPYITNGNTVQTDELNSRLQYLGQVQAGLLAQWNDLVNQAQRAGIRLTF